MQQLTIRRPTNKLSSNLVSQAETCLIVDMGLELFIFVPMLTGKFFSCHLNNSKYLKFLSRNIRWNGGKQERLISAKKRVGQLNPSPLFHNGSTTFAESSHQIQARVAAHFFLHLVSPALSKASAGVVTSACKITEAWFL